MTRNFKALIVYVCLSLWASALSAQGHWTFDYRQFRYDMTVYFSLQNGDNPVTNLSDYEVAAFVGNECRGVAVFEDQIGQNGVAVQYGYLKVYSEAMNGETVVFKCFDKSAAKERVFAGVTVPFVADSHKGFPSDPVKLVLEYEVDVQSGYADMGTVEGSGVKKSGTSATITATPNEGYKFMGWSDGNTGNPYTFVVDKDVSLTAEFAPKEYTLTFVPDNGQDNIVMKQDYKSIVTAPTGLEKLGFTFNGWDAEVPATTPAHDATYTAQWTRNSYNLKFMNGEDVISETAVPYEGEVTTPATNPTKEGYTFTGWSPKVDLTMPAHDQTYTAQFSINQYKVTFMSDGQIKKSETLDYGSAIVAPDDPIVEGNTFQGWTPTLDANATVPAHDVIYTATFDRNEYYAAFIVDDEVKQNNQVTFGESITAPTVSEKTGYTFKGWQPAIPETMPAHDVSFTAKFEVNSYNVTWKVDDKTRVDQVTYNTAITKPVDPVKEGYSFAGWDADIPELMPAGNLTFTAQFTVNSYKVKFIIDGEEKENSIAYGQPIVEPEANKVGYSFTGWSPTLLATVPAWDVTYTAQFTINKYTVTFKDDDGTELSTTKQDYATEIAKPSNPQKTGFTFKDWNPVVPATLPSSDVTYTATYDRNIYKSMFVDGDKELYEYDIAFEGEVSKPDNPTKNGYTFSGWQPVLLEKMPANDVTYTAQWTPVTYDISYELAGGALAEGVTNAATYTIESEVITLANPTREGYTFAGWTGTNLTEATMAVTIATGSTGARSFTATWTPITYNISYDLTGGALAEGVSNDATYTIESEAITLANPTKDYYDFAGWTGTGLTEATTDVTIAKGSIGDRSYAATWTPSQFAITYDLAGGALAEGVSNAATYTIESEAITLANPTREHYTFAGWTGTGLSEATTAVTIVKGSTGARSYTATWTPVAYNISYDLTGGALAEGITNPATYTIESEAITLAEPTKTGYTFAGWTGTDLASATKNVTIAKGSTGARTYTATWTVNQYMVTFTADGVTLKSESQDYGTVIVAPNAPTKEGYTFSGWSPELTDGTTVPANDVTYTAVYTVNKYYVIYMVDGQEWARDEVAYGATIVLRQYTPETGYAFNGWVSDEQYTTMPAHDVTYTADLVTGIELLFKDADYVDVYTITGKFVGRHLTLKKVKQLPRGLYIVNGKRIMVK